MFFIVNRPRKRKRKVRPKNGEIHSLPEAESVLYLTYTGDHHGKKEKQRSTAGQRSLLSYRLFRGRKKAARRKTGKSRSADNEKGRMVQAPFLGALSCHKSYRAHRLDQEGQQHDKSQPAQFRESGSDPYVDLLGRRHCRLRSRGVFRTRLVLTGASQDTLRRRSRRRLLCLFHA